MSFVSVRTRANFSPARNVLSTTAPLPSALSLVRTKAPPLPGLTCWNSTIRQALPSSSICIPFLNWFVLTVSATAAYRLVDDDQVLAEARVVLNPVRGDDHVVLDADAPTSLEVDPGLDGDDVARRERVGREARRLVDVESQAMTQAVPEGPREGGPVHESTRSGICIDSRDPGAEGVEARLLRGDHDGVRLPEGAVDRTRRERTRVIGGVPVHLAAGVDDHGLAAADLAVAGARVRARGVRARGDDGLEGEDLSALVVEELLNRPRDVPLRSADERFLDETLVHPVGNLAGSLDRAELFLLLDRAQLLHQTATGNRLDRAGAQRLGTGVRDEVSLEADSPG